MADYMCKNCKFNNLGWCVAEKRNKLSEILECATFKRGKYGQFEQPCNKQISKKADDFIKIPLDIETLDAIAKELGCHRNNLDWWEVSQHIKDKFIE